MELAFKKYTSRFANGFDTDYQDNGYGTIMYVIPRYHIIEAVQVNSFNADIIMKLVNSRSGLLNTIDFLSDIPYINYPITCTFESSSFNPQYSITIRPNEYLIWDEEIQRFLVLSESVFLMLYKESSW